MGGIFPRKYSPGGGGLFPGKARKFFPPGGTFSRGGRFRGTPAHAAAQ